MSCTGAELLMETARLRMIRIRRPSAALIVTFSNYADDGVEGTAFGEHFFAAHDLDAVHLIARDNHWFELEEMARALDHIRAIGEDRPLFTYGSSMGGYAALRFGGALGATRAIAISPQYGLGRDIVRGEYRWAAEAHTVRLVPEQATATIEPSLLFYDPRNIDAAHAALWRGRVPVETVPLPFAGHPATTFLAQVGLLGKSVRNIVEGQWNRDELLVRARSARRDSGQYLAQLATAQPGHRRGCALALAGRAVEAAKAATDYLGLHAVLLYRAGRDDEAEALHRRARMLAPEDAMSAFRLSRFLQRVGRYAAALTQAEEALRLAPSNRALDRHRRNLAASCRRWGLGQRLLSRLRHHHNRLGWRRGWRLIDRLARP